MIVSLQHLNEKFVYAASTLLSKTINANKDLKSISFNKILCIRLDEIGDLCYSLHVFDLLKQKFPNAEITLLCKSFSVSLVQNHPSINKVITDFKELNHNYDLIIELRGSWKSIYFAAQHKPIARLDRATIRLQNKKSGKHPHEVITNLQIIEPLLDFDVEYPEPKIYLNSSDEQKALAFLKENKINQFAVFHTQARKKLRRWDENNFVELANYINKKYKLDIIFIGSRDEYSAIEKIQNKLNFKSFNIAGEFNLSEFAAIVSKTKIYIGNESGPLAIASVCNVPILGLFGPGEPEVFYPYGKKTEVLHHILECNPCDQIYCKHSDNPCINQITVQEAIIKIDYLLK